MPGHGRDDERTAEADRPLRFVVEDLTREVVRLVARGRMREATAAWREARDATRGQDGVVAVLHVPVATVAMRRAQTDLAREVLDDLPEEVRRADPVLRGMEAYLALLDAESLDGSVFPASLHPDDCWSGPHLPTPFAGAALERWIPGCVDDVHDMGVVLFVALREADGEVGHGTVDASLADFASWSGGVAPVVGRHLEMTFGGGPDPHVSLHAAGCCDVLPDLPPDLERILVTWDGLKAKSRSLTGDGTVKPGGGASA